MIECEVFMDFTLRFQRVRPPERARGVDVRDRVYCAWPRALPTPGVKREIRVISVEESRGVERLTLFA